ncbi:MAG: AraC family transcriptional regulator [Pseudomonadales bacterium]|nr:AraC family transcriptional regulator [Pseudomonadales bacterium]
MKNFNNVLISDIYPKIYFDIASDRGVDPGLILHRSKIRKDIKYFDGGYVSGSEMLAIVDSFLMLAGNYGVGIDVGARVPPTEFGSLGKAILCSEDFSEALNLIKRFWHLHGYFIIPDLTISGESCYVDFISVVGVPEHLEPIIFETTVSCICSGARLFDNSVKDAFEVWFDRPRLIYDSKTDAFFKNTKYNMPSNRLLFDKDVLAHKMPFHNPIFLEDAVRDCEREAIGLERHEDCTTSTVRLYINEANYYPSFRDIANVLCISPRTLGISKIIA